MKNIQVTLFNGDVTEVNCSVLFMKHIEGFVCMPERAINDKLKGKLFSLFSEKEKEDSMVLPTGGQLPYPYIHIINFHFNELPFKYTSVDTYARKIIDFAFNDTDNIDNVSVIATAVHGPGAGLDSSEAMEKMIMAIAAEIQQRGSTAQIEEIIFVEKDISVVERLKERLAYLVKQNVLTYDNGKVYLTTAAPPSTTASEQSKGVNLEEKHIFIAMPFDRNFDDVYLYGIKQAVEKAGRVSERTDQQYFTGDIIERIKMRISQSELIIADISGNNPNVFYEVGLADGMGLIDTDKKSGDKAAKKNEKKIIFITQEAEAPFDITPQNRIKYDRFAIRELEVKLEAALNDILKEGA